MAKSELAMHEKLEVHEVLLFKTSCVKKSTAMLELVEDKDLKKILEEELKRPQKQLKIYPKFWRKHKGGILMTTKTEKLNTLKEIINDQAIATDLLMSSKAGVRNLAIAITETATPEVKKVLKRELENAIDLHDKIAQYMIEKEMYHAYDMKEQVAQDLKNAEEALNVGK